MNYYFLQTNVQNPRASLRFQCYIMSTLCDFIAFYISLAIKIVTSIEFSTFVSIIFQKKG